MSVLIRYPDKPGGKVAPSVLDSEHFPPGEWMAQLKYDGHRCVIFWNAEDASLDFVSRHGKPLPVHGDLRDGLRDALVELDRPDLVIDSEWMGRRQSDRRERLWLLDLLECDDLATQKLYGATAAKRLEKLQAAVFPNLSDWVVETWTAGGWRDLFEKSRTLPGCEGIVLKRVNSTLVGRRGESAKNFAWIKCKWREGEAGTTVVH